MRKRKLTKKEQDELDYKEIRSYKSKFDKIGYYVNFICGILILLVGLYLTFADKISIGTTLPGRSGSGGGQSIILNGPVTLFLGVFFLILPVYSLIKKNKKTDN